MPDPPKPSRVEDLHRAIRSIDEITSHLDDLIDLVQGATPRVASDKKEQDSVVNLASILSTGPEFLNCKVNDCHAKISELQEILR